MSMTRSDKKNRAVCDTILAQRSHEETRAHKETRALPKI